MIRVPGYEAPTPLLVGGRYRLGETLGAGAVGVVRLAQDELLDRQVAIKQLAVPPAPSSIAAAPAPPAATAAAGWAGRPADRE